MTTDTRAPQAAEMARPVASPLDRRLRLTVDRYYEWIERGIFGEDDPFYLWKGWLVEKMTKNRPHSIALAELSRVISPIVPAGWYFAIEEPLQLGHDSMPEPDLTIIRGTPRDYPSRYPTAGDVALLVEVADSSLAEDQGEMLREYARAGLPVYWIVNIPRRRIEVYTEPTDEAEPPLYRVLHLYLPGDEIPVVIGGREVGRIAVADVLP